MKSSEPQPGFGGAESLLSARALAAQALSRTAGAPLIEGNGVRLLRDARENYPAWLEAIAAARQWIHFENYIFREDKTGAMFAQALIARARAGVKVRVIYDWMGGFGRTSRKFWARLREAGIEVRCYNPPRLDAPLGWVSRDHRKTLAVDGAVAFVTGLCVGQMWAGDPEKNIQPWRDTGIEVKGPAVAEIAHAFAQVWASLGAPLPAALAEVEKPAAPAGSVAMRIVATVPATAGILRLDQLVAALATERVWLTDAYYAGTPTYAQALMAAARGSVDVRLLVPGASDIALVKSISRAGFRPLLEAGVRIFEWNGTMLHAKTAVADSRWARVGSTNLNVASWLGNCELDAVIEDEPFALEMEDMYLEDLENATEIVLDAKRKLRAPGQPRVARPSGTSGRGSAGRVAAGTIRISNALGAAFTGRRTLEPVEARLTAMGGGLLLALAALIAFLPRLLSYPIVFVLTWIALTLLIRSIRLYRLRKTQQNLIAEASSPPSTDLTRTKLDLPIGGRAGASVPVADVAGQKIRERSAD
ncbi:MAG: cardiolipin synthase B [Verrucomicrobia bacterium]|nr:MAG: cardiolipin synthase B [Verrucomicrobiota bacterium]